MIPPNDLERLAKAIVYDVVEEVEGERPDAGDETTEAATRLVRVRLEEHRAAEIRRLRAKQDFAPGPPRVGPPEPEPPVIGPPMEADWMKMLRERMRREAEGPEWCAGSPEPDAGDNRRLVRNRAQCRKCHEIVESRGTHDYKTCSCGNLSVDGGLDYNRRVFQDRGYIELSEYADEDGTRISIAR